MTYGMILAIASLVAFAGSVFVIIKTMDRAEA